MATLPNTALYVDDRAFRLWMREVGIDMRELTEVHKQVASAVLPVYRAAIPVLASSPGKRRRPPIPGLLRDSARAGATRKAALVRVGRNLLYARPVTFGWPGHSIAPHRWDLAAMPVAGVIARGVYETGIRALLMRHGAWT